MYSSLAFIKSTPNFCFISLPLYKTIGNISTKTTLIIKNKIFPSRLWFLDKGRRTSFLVLFEIFS